MPMKYHDGVSATDLASGESRSVALTMPAGKGRPPGQPHMLGGSKGDGGVWPTFCQPMPWSWLASATQVEAVIQTRSQGYLQPLLDEGRGGYF
jgi:hypothetical protein